MRILVKLPNWVGDSVMATPALDWLRRTLPDAEIDGIARRAAAGVLADHPSLDNLIEGDERKPDPQFVARLKERHYDVAALMPNSFGTAWFAWRLGIPRRAGFSRSMRGRLLTDPVAYRAAEWQTPAPEPLSRRSRVSGTAVPGHMVDYYQRVAEAAARAAGAVFEPVTHTMDTPLTLAHDPRAEKLVEDLLHGRDARATTGDPRVEAGVEKLAGETGAAAKPLIALNPGAAYGGAKRWPLERLAQCGDAIAARLGGVLVSTASRFEADMAGEVARLAKSPVLRLGEQLDLPGLTALLRRAAVLVTNDSGAMHIAAATDTPTVAVFGPTDWNVTFPWSRRAVVVRESPGCAPCLLRECPIDHRCMQSVTAEQVAEVALSLLGARDGGGDA